MSEVVDVFLEKGSQFSGTGWGDFSKPRGGEFVFCTAMSGIEESLTDPSFAKQVLVNTVSHVGNTGVNFDDMESSQIWAEGLIARHVEKTPSNWRNKKPLIDWMIDHKRFVVEDVDTRALTQTLRDQGSQRALVVSQGTMTAEQAMNYLKQNIAPMAGLDLTKEVTCSEPYQFKLKQDAYWPHLAKSDLQSQRTLDIAVWDFGVKNNTLRILESLGSRVHVLPSTAKAEDLLAAGKSGILLSNGPGDPAAATYLHQELKKVLGRVPTFAICLGHQLVAHAIGGKTYKMPFGHRGIHHPVVQKNIRGEVLRTWITSQNHGFAVDRDSLPKSVWVSFEHADDHSVEGLTLSEQKCHTVQFHPEAAPGPYEASAMLVEFMESLRK